MQVSFQRIPKPVKTYRMSDMKPGTVAIVQSSPRGRHNRNGEPVVAINEQFHHLLGFGLVNSDHYMVRDLLPGEVVSITNQ